MKNIILLGKRSVVSQAIQRWYIRHGPNCSTLRIFSSDEMDLFRVAMLDPNAPPSTIINCVGYTDVERANDDAATASRVNVEFIDNVCLILMNAWYRGNEPTSPHRLVHLSSDYALYRVGESSRKISSDRMAYANTKRLGDQILEKRAASFGLRYHIAYLSTVLSMEKFSLVKAALDAEGSIELDLPDTRLLRPTYANWIPRILFRNLDDPSCPVKFTVGPMEAVSPRMIVEYARMYADLPSIKIVARDQSNRAFRPEWTMAPMPRVMSQSEAFATGHWTDHIEEYIDELTLHEEKEKCGTSKSAASSPSRTTPPATTGL